MESNLKRTSFLAWLLCFAMMMGLFGVVPVKAQAMETYRVTLDANGGEFYDEYGDDDAPDFKTVRRYNVEKDHPYVKLDKYRFKPEREGYVFLGYSKEKDGDLFLRYNRAVTTKAKISGDITLYAVWEKAEEIIWDANGGTLYNTEKTLCTWQKKGDILEIPDSNIVETRKTNRYFAGWSKTKDGKTPIKDTDLVEGTTTFYAIWKKGVTVTLEANGGRLSYEDFDQPLYGKVSVKRAQICVNPDENTLGELLFHFQSSEKGKKKLAGFSTKKNGTIIQNPDYYYFRKNTKLYAVYQKETQYEVRLNANGGYFPKDAYSQDGKEMVFTVKKGEIFSTALYFCEPETKKNKVFVGWSTKSNGKGRIANEFEVNHNLTLYAVWKDAYKITFDLNGKEAIGGITKSVIKIKKGNLMEIPNELTLLSDEEKAFLGWSTSKKETDIIPNFFSYKPKKNMKLYAIWKDGVSIGDYDVIFESGNSVNYTGKKVMPSISVYDAAGNKVEASNYDVTYYNNKKPGEAVAVITGKNGIVGCQYAYFTILYWDIVKVKSVSPVKGQRLKIKWNRCSTAKDYKAYVVDKKTGEKRTFVTKDTKVTTKPLEKGHTYMVYVRPRVKDNMGEITKGNISNITQVKVQ